MSILSFQDPGSPSFGTPKLDLKFQQPHCDVRSIELQELEDCHKVMNEVKKRLNVGHLKRIGNTTSHSQQPMFQEFYEE